MPLYQPATGGNFSSSSGVSTGAVSSSTQTITHGLGRIPITIRTHALGGFSSNSSAVPTPSSHGTYTSSGNRCVYYANGGSTSSQNPSTSTTFGIYLVTTGNSQASGVIQNLTSTTFDIVWTVTGDTSAVAFIWEAQ